MNMTTTLTSIVLLILLCGTAYGTRTKSFPAKNEVVLAALAPSANDGICKTMVETQGYACEEHMVTTQDGFVLGLQRIPEGKSGGGSGNRPPVLLQHGILMDAAVWLVLPPTQSLAFLLADDGFDVWLANTRGSKSSRGHTSLSPTDPAFWDWSWDELVADELPAMFQYIHNQTGQNLHYIGHSLGSLVALAAFSKKQSLDILRSAALLGPGVYMGQINSTFTKVGADLIIANVPYWLKIAEFFPIGTPEIALLNQICKSPGVDCTDLLTAFTGPNCCIDNSLLSVLLGHGAQSTASKNVIHLSQMIKAGTVTMYDYNNAKDNMRHYGQTTPPVYNMTNIPSNIPLFFGHGGVDALADVKDVQLLLDSLKDHDKDKLVVHFVENYAHADFLLGLNAKAAVYQPVIDFLKLY